MMKFEIRLTAWKTNDKMLATRALCLATAAVKPFTTLEMMTAIRMDLDGSVAPADEALD
jgi:hypothetical protein